jgi:hypothetical protein
MKNLIILVLAIILVAVLFYAGFNGITRDHAYGPLFIFLGVCGGTGLTIDVRRLVKERVRRDNAKKFGR